MADLEKQMQADRDDAALAEKERKFLLNRIARCLELDGKEGEPYLGARVRNILIRAIDTVEKHKV